MFKSTPRVTMQVLLVLLAATLSLNALAASRLPASARPEPQLTQSYVWYDGDREQTVWLNPQVVAEFNPGSNGVSAVRSADANAMQFPMKHTQQGIRLWQINNTGGAAVRGLSSSNPTGKYSPVFIPAPAVRPVCVRCRAILLFI